MILLLATLGAFILIVACCITTVVVTTNAKKNKDNKINKKLEDKEKGDK